jgi:prepilin-type N-terminal cleavage/methylation domain-containing protein
MARPGSRGLTLLEMVVVLVLLGVALTLSVPSLDPPRPRSDDPLQRVLDDARRAAIRRSQSLFLAIEADGRWVVEAAREGESETVLRGRLGVTPIGALRVLVSPLGACWIEAEGSGPAAALDPLRCRLSRASAS